MIVANKGFNSFVFFCVSTSFFLCITAFHPGNINHKTSSINKSSGRCTTRAFVTFTTRHRNQYPINHFPKLNSIIEDNGDLDDSLVLSPKNTILSEAVLNEGASILDFELIEHKPLGCTVEESAYPEPDGSKPVFIAKVSDGGNAVKAGLCVGDVIIGISGVFDEIEDVSESGLARVKTLVSGRYPDKSLRLRIIRGTEVMARHESHLVSLCTLPGGTDDDLDECLDALMQTESLDEIVENIDCDEDGECMLDTMFEAWGDEILENKPTSSSKAQPTEMEIEATKKKSKARPWASRSSPSGTYVRDPTTGKMKNIS